MADTYVLVHGAWHTGAEMEAVAGHLRKSGHVVHCPTVAGNNKDDDRETTGLEQAISSIVTYIEANDLRDIRLVGHSYGGMVISPSFRWTGSASTTWCRRTMSACSMRWPPPTRVP